MALFNNPHWPAIRQRMLENPQYYETFMERIRQDQPE